MSLNLGTIYALVTLDDADYKKKLSGLESSSNSAFQNIAKAAAAYLSLKAVSSFVRGTVNAFSDLEEETNKFNVVFAGMGKQTSEILAQMREDFGLSELAAKRMLAGTGDILTGFGFDKKLALTLSEGVSKLGADIASFSNYAGGAAGAANALTRAMLGEAESAKALGVVVLQDSEEMKALKEQAMTTGITIKELGDAGKNIVVSTEQQAKAVAALALAYQQSPNAIGDFKRSQDSIANQTRILENNFEELTSKIGGDLAPAYRDALSLTNDLVAAYNSLDPMTRSLANSTVLLAGASLLLGKAKISLMGVAAGFNAISVSAKKFALSIGPIGWAILALGGAYALASAMQKKYNAELNATTEASSKRLDLAKKMTATHQQEANSATAQFMRLKELAKYERLNNAEMEEANGLIQTLTGLYGELGISIDKATGKLVIATNAFGAMNEEQRKIALKDVVKEYQAMIALTTSKGNELHNEVSDIFTSGFAYQSYNKIMRWMENTPGWLELMDKQAFNDMQNQVSSAQKLAKTKDQIIAFQKIYQKLVEEGDNEEAQKALELVELLQEQLKLESDIEKIRNGNTKPQGNKGGKKPEEAEKESKKLRDALASLADTEFEIRFNFSDESQQVDMLNEKVQDVFDRQSGKYKNLDEFVNADRHKMNEQEIMDLETIIVLQSRRAQIEKESAEDYKSERESYLEVLEQRAKQAQTQKIEKEIQDAQAQGNGSRARVIIERELAIARKAAQQMEQEYLSALELAQVDRIYTANERKNVEQLKRKWQQSLSDQDKWQSRIDTGKHEEEKKVADVVGSYSLQVLASQLGGPNTPEKETARNTKRIKELLDKINDTVHETTGVYK